MADEIRIGVFFDGTGNNMWVDNALGGNSQTNIADLYDLYGAKGYEVLYEEGVGTEAYKTDNDAKAISETTLQQIRDGQISKNNELYYKDVLRTGSTTLEHADNMLAEIADSIDLTIKENPNAEIKIDVYGFSRGAASARHFINEMNQQFTNINGGSLVGFVGLFDTVAAIGLPNDNDGAVNLNLNEDSADYIVQLTAGNEVRDSFGLDTLANSTGANIKEIELPGVHSDIGGGYSEYDFDTIRHLVHDSGNETFLTEKQAQERLRELNEIVANLNFDDPDIPTNATYELQQEITPPLGGIQSYRLDYVIVETREIEYGLSDVALREMLYQINNYGISLDTPNNLVVPSGPISNYIHISESDNWYDPSRSVLDIIADWFAHRSRYIDVFFDRDRDYYLNDIDKAEVDLLNLSDEDKTILYDQKPDRFTIMGVTEYELSLLDNYSENFAAHRAEYLNLHLNPELRIYLDEFPTGSLTSYIDTESETSYKGRPIDGADQIIFGTNEDDTLELDQGFLSLFGSGNQIVYGKDGNDFIKTGDGDDWLEGGRDDDELYGEGDDDTLIGGEGVDKLYGDAGEDTLYAFKEDEQDEAYENTLVGGGDDDTIHGADGVDTIYGDNEDGSGSGNDDIHAYDGDDKIYAGDGDDVIEGGEGADTIEGGKGDDIIFHNVFDSFEDDNATDTLDGGDGFDTYYVGNGDEITDSDRKGRVIFQEEDLTGVKRLKKGSETEYTDDMGYTYKEDGSTLTVTKDGQSFTIENWDSDNQQGLGIELNNKIKVTIEDNSEVEAAQTMTFTVSLSRALNDGEELSLDVKGETITFSSGEKTKN